MTELDATPLEDFCIFVAKGCNPAELEAATRDLQRMMKQKTAGQPGYAKSKDLSFDNHLDRVRMIILANAVGMVRDGTIDRLMTDVPPVTIQDKTGLKDADRNILEENEAFWGKKVDPDVLKTLVGWLENAENEIMREQYKKCIICEAYAIVLSGRLPTP